jgi:hypothetical protein
MTKKKTPPSIGQFALSERDDLLATIADQSREIAAMKAQPGAVVMPELDQYDAGLLNDFGGGNVDWWQDYMRAELDRAHDFYQSQVSSLNASRVPEGWQLVPVEMIEHVRHARKLLGGDPAPEYVREKLRQKLTDLLAAPTPAPSVEPAHSDAVSVPRELLELIDEAMCDFLGEDDPLLGDLRALLAGAGGGV